MSFVSGLNQSGVVGQIPNAVNGLMTPAAPVGGTTAGPDAATVAGQNSMNQWGQPADPGTAALVNAAFNPANTMQTPINPTVGMESGGPVPGTRAMPVVRRNAGSRTAGPQLMRGPASGVNPATMQSPEDPGTPMLARGGVMPINRGGIPMRPAMPGAVVPGMQAGGALPAGPEQGIVPASTEGQVLTMDGGGAVPGFEQTANMPIQQAQVAQPQVAGGRAGLVSGIASGQVIGNNLLNAWHQHEQREIAADAAPGMESTVTGIPQTPETSPMDTAKNSVEQFFHHLHGGLLDDNHLPNSNQGTPGPYNPTGAANPVPGGGPSPYGAPAPAGIPSGAGGAPTPGAPPAPAGAAPGGAPAPAPATPGGQPAPQGTPPIAPNGPPAGQGGNAFTATQSASTLDAVKAAASDPAAQQGIPQKSPAQSGQEHSLSPDWYEHSEQLKMKAMHDAALAGQDPMKVGAAMDALRTGAVQGQVMRNYAAANAAFASGDDKALKQALQNVNYYLPNGKGIDIKTATAADVKANAALANDPLTGQPKPGYDPNMHPGALMYKSPFAGMAGHENDPPYTTVTQQHISMLAQNALDPSTVQKSMLASYTAQRETQAKLMSAQGTLATGQGRLDWGQAQLAHAQTQSDYDKATTPTRVALMRSQVDYNEAHANQAMSKANAPAAGVKVTLPAVRAAQNDAIKTVDEAVQGPMTAIPGQIPRMDPRTGQPMMGPNGQPLMTINASPGAGRSVRDPTKADPLFQGMHPEDVATVKDYAGALAGANVGITNPQEVAGAAARIVRYDQKPTFHLDPATKKQVPDVVRDKDQGTVHVWDGHQMHNFYTRANISDTEASPVSSDNDNGPAGGNPADNAPAVEAGGAAEADAINGQ